MYWLVRTFVFISVSARLIHAGIDLSKIPNPMPHFDIDRYLGVWYDQGKVAPCSWAGSREFTDWKLTFRFEDKKLVLIQDWRSGEECVNIKSELTERSPGCYTIKDPIGNVYTGEEKIVATDYKSFSITYGCVKRDVGGDTCSTPWLSVETKARFPDPYTLKIIDKVLMKLFGFTLAETERVKHGTGC